jgi:hypothetical protein
VRMRWRPRCNTGDYRSANVSNAPGDGRTVDMTPRTVRCGKGTKAFFDTNVLLYMYGGEAGKRARAKALYREHALTGRMLLSTQVVQEFRGRVAQLGIPRPELLEAAAALLRARWSS